MLASGLRSVDFWQPVAITRQQAQMTILIFVQLSIRYSAPFVGQVLEILPCSVIAEHCYDEVNHRLSSGKRSYHFPSAVYSIKIVVLSWIFGRLISIV